MAVEGETGLRWYAESILLLIGKKVIVKRIPFFVKWKKSGWSIEKNDNAGEWNSRLADEAGLIRRLLH